MRRLSDGDIFNDGVKEDVSDDALAGRCKTDALAGRCNTDALAGRCNTDALAGRCKGLCGRDLALVEPQRIVAANASRRPWVQYHTI